jgi:MFS family permease
MNFQKINNITGWIIGLIACAVYVLSMEPTGSLWDTGEFISCAYKLGIPHPPGAPLFIMLGRLFTLFTPGDAAIGVNLLSALSSGFTIMFLFWTITHFGRRLVEKAEEELQGNQLIAVMAAGVVGALAYTFSDSFWYSAVEGEVYALSSFFTAIVFWMILKWEHEDSKAGEDDVKRTHAERWIVLTFFMMGLSIGVHLLNLLTIPAIVMVYYFRRYKPTWKGGMIAFLIGCVVTGLVQKAVIQWSIGSAGWFDRLFVNSFGLPFFSGFIFFFLLLAAGIWFGLRWAQANHKRFLRVGLWCFAFMLIGYSSYLTTMIRSNANPGIDMNDVNNPITLVSYLSREQYGDVPLLKGQVFTAKPVDESGNSNYKKVGDVYQKVGDKYEIVGEKMKPVYQPAQTMVFPRVWDGSNDQGHADYYARFLDIQQLQNQQTGELSYERDPNMADNFKFFFGYQVNIMYLRYFMWNFAGKQNDLQGLGERRNGNWLTGIPFVDDVRLSNQKLMPDSLKNNPAHNKYYLLPFILGMFGLVFQVSRKSKDGLIVGLLFFFTGMAIVLYLNQAGPQPRERDYAFVGSFYAFAIWIGLAVIGLIESVKRSRQEFLSVLGSGAVSTLAVLVLSTLSGTASGTLGSSLGGTAVFAGTLALLYFLLKGVSGNGKNEKLLVIATSVLCLVVPILMASQNWDDHDRSKKTIAPDLATNYLESCAPNAILFTVGDNDTYPLWYAQEVKGIRPDVRVINTSLLGTDWYINQLRYKVNESDVIDVIWSEEQIAGDKRNVTYHIPVSQTDTAFYDLYTMMKDQAGSDAENKMYRSQGGDLLNYFFANRFKVPVDPNVVRANGTVTATDSVLSELRFTVPKSYLFKNDAAILNIIAANNWKRPIYFTQPYDLGFDEYLRQDGLTFRLVPVANARGSVNVDWMMDKVMNKFKYGGAEKDKVYFDEENRRHMVNTRNAHTILAMNLIAAGRKEDAKKVLQRADQMLKEQNIPYGMASRYRNDHNTKSYFFGTTALQAGDIELGKRVLLAVKKDAQQQMAFYESIVSGDGTTPSDFEYQAAKQLIEGIDNALKQYAQGGTPPSDTLQNKEVPQTIKNSTDTPK